MRASLAGIFAFLAGLQSALAVDVECESASEGMYCTFTGESLERSRFEISRESDVLLLHLKDAQVKKNHWVTVEAPGIKRVFWMASKKAWRDGVLRVRYTEKLTEALIDGVKFEPQAEGMRVWIPTVEGASAQNPVAVAAQAPAAVENNVPSVGSEKPSAPEAADVAVQNVPDAPKPGDVAVKDAPDAPKPGDVAVKDAPEVPKPADVEGKDAPDAPKPADAEGKDAPDAPKPSPAAADDQQNAQNPPVVAPREQKSAGSSEGMSSALKKGIAGGLAGVGFICLLLALWLFHRKSATSPVQGMWKISEQGVISVLKMKDQMSLLYTDDERQELLVESDDTEVLHQELNLQQVEQAKRAWEQLQKAVSLGEPMQHRLSEKALWQMAAWLWQMAEDEG